MMPTPCTATEYAAAELAPTPDCAAAIAGLRQSGADLLDPVQFHYLEALSARAHAQQGSVKRLLEGKLALALAAFEARLAQAQSSAPDHAAPHAPKPPQCETLGELVRSMAQHAAQEGDAVPAEAVGARTELKSVRHFRNTWSKLSADKQLSQALDQAPKNAGPINSHMLVLRSLALMREIAPDYLNRFIAYADTLLCLEQSEKAKYAAAKPAAKSASGSSGAKPAKPKTKARKPRAH